MKQLSDKKIVDSWKNNVTPWVSAIKNNEITSRVLVTNQAILDSIKSRNPKTVLDIGCGEGWLVRSLADLGIDALGIDVIPEFIDYASKEGKGRYKVLSYENISANKLKEKYDVVVSNFSLLGKESVEHVFQQVTSLLKPGGAFIVQTIHPMIGFIDGNYNESWRTGSWNGFSTSFTDPAPWYFRTLNAWSTLFSKNGFVLTTISEPINKKTKTVASIIYIGELIN